MRSMKEHGLFFDVGLDSVSLTCRKCGAIISTDGKKSDIDTLPFHRENVEFAGFCCPKCGNKEFDMDIFVEMLCYQANKSETGNIS